MYTSYFIRCTFFTSFLVICQLTRKTGVKIVHIGLSRRQAPLVNVCYGALTYALNHSTNHEFVDVGKIRGGRNVYTPRRTKKKTGQRYNPSDLRILWSGRLDSNQRPHGPEPCALPNCATSRSARKYFSRLLFF